MMPPPGFVRLIAGSLFLTMFANARADENPGPLVRSLWLVQRFGTPEAIDVKNDQKVKGKLAKALGKEGVLKLSGVQGFMDPSTFARLAGSDGTLDRDEVARLLEAEVPGSRKRLKPKILAHADVLTTSLDLIDETHRKAGESLADWIVKNHKPGQSLDITVICTGNSRRSILGATMGNVASAYHGMPEVRFHSGGTAPTAFNPRTIACLKEIGVDVEPTGKEAPRGDSKTANPIYRVRWGTEGLETIEFSKNYADPSNPRSGFAALLVCGEADEACPIVKGASSRVSMPYLDPKIYDDSDFEALKYAERRDDIGRLMLATLMQARNRLDRHETAH